MRWAPPRTGNPGLIFDLTFAWRVYTESLERQSRRLLGRYYINLSVEVILHHVLPSLTPALTHTQGGRFDHRLFHTCVLPHLLPPGSPFGLLDVLHADALKAAEYRGGLNGPLVRGTYTDRCAIKIIVDEYVMIYMVSSQVPMGVGVAVLQLLCSDLSNRLEPRSRRRRAMLHDILLEPYHITLPRCAPPTSHPTQMPGISYTMLNRS